MGNKIPACLAVLALILVPTSARADLVPYAGDLTLLSGTKPYLTPNDFWATMDAEWDTGTQTFTHFTLQVGGGFPVSTAFNEPFVYLYPGWYASTPDDGFRLALPMTPIASPAQSCCGYYFDAVNGTGTFRLDGYALQPTESAPLWLPAYVAGFLDTSDVIVQVLNKGLSCFGCVVIGPVNDESPLLRRIYSPDVTAVEERPARPGATLHRLLGGFPNPVMTETQVRFTLGRAEQIDVRIFDAAGRLVRRLASGELGSGVHSIHWDCRNEGGQRVGSGVYSIQMRAGDEVHSQRAVVLRR